MSAVLLIALLAAGPAAAQLYGTLPAARVAAGTLSFDGQATVGDFIGKTTEVTGSMESDRYPTMRFERTWT